MNEDEFVAQLQSELQEAGVTAEVVRLNGLTLAEAGRVAGLLGPEAWMRRKAWPDGKFLIQCRIANFPPIPILMQDDLFLTPGSVIQIYKAEGDDKTATDWHIGHGLKTEINTKIN